MGISIPTIALEATDRTDAKETTIVKLTTVEPGQSEPELLPDGTFQLFIVTPANTGHMIARIDSEDPSDEVYTVGLKIWDGAVWQPGILTGS